MCGRIEYVVTSKKQLEGHYNLKLFEGVTYQGITTPRYNIAPSSITPIVTSEDNEEIVVGHWGFLPSWAKEKGSAKEVINARAETVLEKPYFKSSIITRRCLIPVTGFFEWKRSGKTKTPYRFYIDNDIFSLAGLYTNIKDEKGVDVPHYAIITTEANSLMAPVHNRMPVIIDKSDEQDWVSDKLSDSDIHHLLKPYPSKLMKKYEISSQINNPKNNDADVIKQV